MLCKGHGFSLGPQWCSNLQHVSLDHYSQQQPPAASEGHVSDTPTTSPNMTLEFQNQPATSSLQLIPLPSYIDCFTTKRTTYTYSFVNSVGIVLESVCRRIGVLKES